MTAPILHAFSAALILMLLWLLRRESVRRGAAEAELGARIANDQQAERLALAARRRSLLPPLDAVAAAWACYSRPAPGQVASALEALAEARLAFPPDAAIEEAAAQLGDYQRLLASQRAMADEGGSDHDLIDRAIALEQALRPRLDRLRERLAGQAPS